jgi:hypothetical protein
MTEARVPRLPLEEAKAAADEAGIPDYMAQLSIFQVLLNHPTLARAVNDLLAVRAWSNHDGFGAAERAVLVATDEVVRDGAVSAQTWAVCERELGTDSALLIELVTAIGAWRMIASILHSLVGALGSADIIDRHRDRGGSRPLLEVVVRPRRSRAGGINRRCDHAAVVVRAVVGEVVTEGQSNRDVVGFVALEHNAQPAHIRRGRHQFDYRLSAPLLLVFGQ